MLKAAAEGPANAFSGSAYRNDVRPFGILWKFLNLIFTFAVRLSESAHDWQHPPLMALIPVDFFSRGIHLRFTSP
jgi:hypothetical protein